MIPRYLRAPSQSFFLFGPRGTGKSTWLRATFPNSFYIDLLDPAAQQQYLAYPQKLLSVVRALAEGTTVVIDEVQRVPELLSAVHALIEEKGGWRFVLTGSSARKLKRAGVDLLAGRALLRTMHPFMGSELGERFDLESALQQGMVASVDMSPDPPATLAAYVSLYIREEVQLEGLVRNLGTFTRFLHSVSFSQASQINAASIGRECGVDRKTVEAWIQILEDLLIATTVQPFTKRAARAVVSHPKFFLFDSGIYRSLRPKGPLDRPAEIDGIALESLVFQHLRAWIAYSESDAELYFWRTRSGTEVDFVLYGERAFYAIEVKNASRIRTEDLKALKAFGQDYPESDRMILYRGEEHLLIDGIAVIPAETFLRTLRPGKPLERLFRVQGRVSPTAE